MEDKDILGRKYFDLLGVIGVLVLAREELPKSKSLKFLIDKLCIENDHITCDILIEYFSGFCKQKKLIKEGYIFTRDDINRGDYYVCIEQ